jgi:hypothetical protein
MDNPFERRATEQVRNEEAFLSLVSPEPITTYLRKFGSTGQLYDRLVVVLGTPGSGKTTMAKLFEFPMVSILLRNSSSQAHRALLTALTECGAIANGSPTVLACRLPLESDYREIWELPYSEDFKDALLKAFVQARAILGWFRHLARTGVRPERVKVLTTGGSHAASEAIGGLSGDAVLQKAQEVERAIYRVVGALLPPGQNDLGEDVTQAYRPFDVIDSFSVPFGENSTSLEIRPLAVLDDAHTLHPTQFRNLTRWLIKRELRVSRWVLTRFDVLTPDEAIGALIAGNGEEAELPGVTTAREITRITLQSVGDRREQRSQFRKMAKDMSARYLSQMPEFASRKLVSLETLLVSETEHLTSPKTNELRKQIDASQKRLTVSEERRKKLLGDINKYHPSSRILQEDEKLAMLDIAMHRYAKRIPQGGLFEQGGDPDPKRPLSIDSSVYEAARLRLLHSYGRPYFFGIDDLCDASSENAEQFLRLAAILVESSAVRLIRGKPPALRPSEQSALLRERAGEFLRDWNFPHFNHVRALVDFIGRRCLTVSLEPNAWIGAGANAYGLLQEEFDSISNRAPDLLRTLKYAVAYSAIILVPRYECKNRLWCLFELGGIPILNYGLSLKRGGFIEGSLEELLPNARSDS